MTATRYHLDAEDPRNRVNPGVPYVAAVRCWCGETEDLKLVGGRKGMFICAAHRDRRGLATSW